MDFDIGKHRIHRDAFDREQEQRREHQRHLEIRAGERDLIAEPGIGADRFRHHGADEGERDRGQRNLRTPPTPFQSLPAWEAGAASSHPAARAPSIIHCLRMGPLK